jgi:hypothetical protein
LLLNRDFIRFWRFQASTDRTHGLATHRFSATAGRPWLPG